MHWNKQQSMAKDKPQNEQGMDICFKKWTIHWTHFLEIDSALKYETEHGKDKQQNEQDTDICFKIWTIHWTHPLEIHSALK